MKNILVISSYPFPLSKGSSQHAYFFIKALTLNFNVYCVFFVQPEVVDHFDNKVNLFDLGIKKFDICYYSNYTKRNKYYDRIKRNLAFPYRYMNLATHSFGLSLIKEYINKYSIDVIHFEHFHYVKYAFRLPYDLKKVVVYHDMYHSIDWKNIRFEKKYINKLELFITGFKKYLFEKLLEKRIDKIIFLNPLEMHSRPSKSIFVPHIVNPEIKYNEPRIKEFLNILFLGGYSHPPNRKSFYFILDCILPFLAEKDTNFTIYIIGLGTEKFETHLDNSQYKQFVKIKGFISDINEVFQGMDIALFPVLYGGGIKTKIIEAMASGVPVVTNPEGIIGLTNLPENCVGVAKTVNGLCCELNILMKDYSIRLERSKAGRNYIEKEHSFNELKNKVRKIYQII